MPCPRSDVRPDQAGAVNEQAVQTEYANTLSQFIFFVLIQHSRGRAPRSRAILTPARDTLTSRDIGARLGQTTAAGSSTQNASHIVAPGARPVQSTAVGSSTHDASQVAAAHGARSDQATAVGLSTRNASRIVAPQDLPIPNVAPNVPPRTGDSPPPAYSRAPPPNSLSTGTQALVSSSSQVVTRTSDSGSSTMTMTMTSTMTSPHVPASQTASTLPSSLVNQVNSIPFYHEHPIVPFPPGLRPLPSFSYTRPPLPPSRASDGQSYNWYFGTAAVNPGLQRATWDEWRANIEAHRGLPPPWGPVFNRVERPVSGDFPPTRVLPPPPRPPVRVDGPHFWTVYVGRVPGVYNTM